LYNPSHRSVLIATLKTVTANVPSVAIVKASRDVMETEKVTARADVMAVAVAKARSKVRHRVDKVVKDKVKGTAAKVNEANVVKRGKISVMVAKRAMHVRTLIANNAAQNQ
jgi:CBS domain-containing protein